MRYIDREVVSANFCISRPCSVSMYYDRFLRYVCQLLDFGESENLCSKLWWNKGRVIRHYMSDSQYKSWENTGKYVHIVAS